MTRMLAAHAAYFRELADKLSDLYQTNEMARVVAESAGMNMSLLSLDGSSLEVWSGILREARKSNRGLLGIMRVVLHDYPNQTELISMLSNMPDSEGIAEGVEKMSQQLDMLQRKITTMQTDVTAVRSDIAVLKKKIIDGVLQWAMNAGEERSR